MTALHCCFCRLKHFFGHDCIQTPDGVQLFAFVRVFLSSFKDLCSYCERQHTFTNVYIWYALIALKVHPLPHPVATFQVRQVSQATVLSQEAYLLFYVLDPNYKRVGSHILHEFKFTCNFMCINHYQGNNVFQSENSCFGHEEVLALICADIVLCRHQCVWLVVCYGNAL